MTYFQMLRAISRAVTHDPPRWVSELWGDYPEPYYHLFYRLARHAKTVVELGVEKGRGSASFCIGNPRCQVYGVETHRRQEIDAVIERFPNFHYIEASSLPIPEGIPEQIDVLHIDTEHSYAQAENEFGTYKSRLVPGSVVCFDDTHAMDDGVLSYLMTLPYPIVLDDRLHSPCGYAVLYYDH